MKMKEISPSVKISVINGCIIHISFPDSLQIESISSRLSVSRFQSEACPEFPPTIGFIMHLSHFFSDMIFGNLSLSSDAFSQKVSMVEKDAFDNSCK